MSFNTVALYGYPEVVPVPFSERPEPFRLRHRRALTVAQGMPQLDATRNVQLHDSSREFLCIWDDEEVKNDWLMAARAQESAAQLEIERAMSYKQLARERKYRPRTSFDKERGRRVSVDRMREWRASVDREWERRVSVDRRRDLRVSVDHERGRRPSTERHHRYGSVSSTSVRPPVNAVSFKPPTQRQHSRRPSFDYPIVRDSSRGRQYPTYILPAPALVPEIYFPSQRRDRTSSVEAVRRFPFPSTEVPRFERPTKTSGLAGFNPFNRLRTASISNTQNVFIHEPPKVHSNRLRRQSTTGRG